jgi:hypothetical protein
MALRPREIAEALGVSLMVVKSQWLDECSDMAKACPKFRADTLKM